MLAYLVIRIVQPISASFSTYAQDKRLPVRRLMDGTPLDQAYSAAKNADAAAIAGDYPHAADLFVEAAAKFDEVATTAPESPALRVLQALAEQHRRHAEYLRSGRAKADIRRAYASSGPAQAPAQQQLAAARGQPTAPTVSPAVMAASAITSSNLSPSSSVVSTVNGDAFNQLLGKSTAALTRSLEQSLGRPVSTGMGGASKLSAAEPSESFYLVKPKGAPAAPQTFSASAVQAAVDAAVRAQRSVLKQGFQQLRQEIASKEQKLQDEHTEETDRLRAENDKLRVQVSRMKSRWDSLKQSARKRREDLDTEMGA